MPLQPHIVKIPQWRAKEIQTWQKDGWFIGEIDVDELGHHELDVWCEDKADAVTLVFLLSGL